MRRAWRFAWLALAGEPVPAHAHTPIPGIEGFYTGLLHPFSTPSQALLMIGLGLLVGGFPVHLVRWHLAAFLAATLAGAFFAGGWADLDTALFATAFAASAWSALIPGRLFPVSIVLVAIAGLLIGDASVPDPGPRRDWVLTLSGALLGANVGILYFFGLMLVVRERFTWPWVGIALRVGAAWVGAISLVMLALGFAPTDAAI